MSFYRSESINHYKLILPRDNAEQIMHSLGQKDMIHITDCSVGVAQKPFLHQVKRCSDSLAKISELEKMLATHRLTPSLRHNHKIEPLFQLWDQQRLERRVNFNESLQVVSREVDEMWEFCQQHQRRIKEVAQKVEALEENIVVIRAGYNYLGDSLFRQSSERVADRFNFEVREMLQPQVNLKAGVIEIGQQCSFKRTIFRVSRGNCLIVLLPFDSVMAQPSKQAASKLVYVLMYAGVREGALDKKINKIASTYCNQTYLMPENQADMATKISYLSEQMEENRSYLKLNEADMQEYLQKIVAPLSEQVAFSKLTAHKLYLVKQMEIYNQLNLMNIYSNFMQADVYIRKQDIAGFQLCLREIEAKTRMPSGQLIESHEGVPPTHFIRNSFTCSAQEIVETYGVPRYKQANPSFFTAVTFPFLFGVMFGDIAHGSLLLLLGSMLVFRKPQLGNEFLRVLHSHRYLITLMGFFSVYCGFIYNDFMSISLNLFGSCYDMGAATPNHPIPRLGQCVYPFGVDPVWNASANNLNYINSLKMKISVIIAVVHMTLGVLIKASNALYFRKTLDLLFQFVPQIVFMVSLFGYMDFLIVYKWLKHWAPYDSSAPSIITTMINIPLHWGRTETCCGGQPMWGRPGDTSQDAIQLLLLLIALICMPLMLLPKPMLLMYRARHRDALPEQAQQLMDEKQQRKNLQHGETNQQIFVHQLIETIEYVLGCISNTASYLRLWALSLAHSQLSEVFFQKTVEKGMAMGYSGIPLMLGLYPVLAAATFGVLLCMDSMECFLHTLRLHWVEFQNKFYKGDGYKFAPFSFRASIEAELKRE